MVAGSRRGRSRLLTDVELELMTILWRLGEGTVAEVLAALPPARKLAYTSVSKVLRILEGRGLVRPRKVGRGHVYAPTIEKPRYQRQALDHVISRVFDGAPVALVRRLVESEALTAPEKDEIRALLRKRRTT
jgi:predicted transcriptional regulator